MGYTVSSFYKKQTLDFILLQDFWEVHHRFEVCLFVTVQHLAVGDDFDVHSLLFSTKETCEEARCVFFQEEVPSVSSKTTHTGLSSPY